MVMRMTGERGWEGNRLELDLVRLIMLKRMKRMIVLKENR